MGSLPMCLSFHTRQATSMPVKPLSPYGIPFAPYGQGRRRAGPDATSGPTAELRCRTPCTRARPGVYRALRRAGPASTPAAPSPVTSRALILTPRGPFTNQAQDLLRIRPARRITEMVSRLPNLQRRCWAARPLVCRPGLHLRGGRVARRRIPPGIPLRVTRLTKSRKEIRK
jgi:hypothetical protein